MSTAPTPLLYFGSRAWVDVPEGWTLRQTHSHIRHTNTVPVWGRRVHVMMRQMRGDLLKCGSIVAVEGEADGADIMSRVIATYLEQQHDPYPVDTKIDGQWPAAGHRRNARMARDGKPTRGRCFCTGDVGTPLSKGSAGMVEILKRLGVPLILHRDNGIENGGAA